MNCSSLVTITKDHTFKSAKKQPTQQRKVKKAANHVIAVGDYNPITQQVNMALWKDVQSALQEINSEGETMRKKHSDIDALAARIAEG